MARKAKSQAAPPPSTPPEFQVAGPDLKGLGLLLLSGVTLLALLGLSHGRLNEGLASALRWLVGMGALPLAAAIGAVGLRLLLRRRALPPLGWGRLLASELFLLCLLALASLLADPALVWSKAAQGVGGGAVGWLLARGAALVGTAGATLLVALVALLLLPAVLGLSLARLHAAVERQRGALERRREQLLAPPPTAQKALPRSEAPTRAFEPAAAPASAPAPTHAPEPAAPAPSVAARVRGAASKAVSKVAAPPAPRPPAPRREASYITPPLDLLTRSSGSGLDPAVAREKARVIEETLRAFGVSAQVVQVNQGPAVTQFGVQPGFVEQKRADGTVQRRKVKVNAITSLADDLALALAARSIRVEAPVPGRAYVGIEVPNSDTELVTLHSVLTSDEFATQKSPIAFALGRDVSGHPIAADLARMPHLLIAGATGAGKSVCVNTIISSFLFNNGPEQLKLLMIDPKMVELIPYNGIPHLIAPVVTDMERAVGALTWAMREMDRRYKLFSEVGKRNHESYNAWAEANGQEPLPLIVIIIDELADLMMVAADQVERIICRIAQMARATGMHLILATQRPSVDVVTGLIKANVPARIAFAVASQIDSRVILDSNGAESLLGRGDMLFQAPDSSKLLRLQGCFVSDQELGEIVGHWLRQGSAPPRPAPPSEESAPETPWDDILEELEAGEQQGDELLDEAIAIIREHQWASTSFLQRKLRIGYTRAARLIDALEAQGVIGPPEGGSSSGSRTVLIAPLEESSE